MVGRAIANLEHIVDVEIEKNEAGREFLAVDEI